MTLAIVLGMLAGAVASYLVLALRYVRTRTELRRAQRDADSAQREAETYQNLLDRKQRRGEPQRRNPDGTFA